VLEAVDRSRNIARTYRIEANRDLFGTTIIDLRWFGSCAAGLD
jgi:hypothetical protein